MKARGGLLTAADLAANHADWVAPISTTYRGYEVLELPPNTQGVVALEMLNILEGFDVKALGHNSAAYLHLLVEAKRIAFADRAAWLGDARSAGGARAHHVEGVRGRAPARNRSGEGGGELQRADARRPATGRAGDSGRQGRHHLHDGRRPRRQRRLADSVDLRELRRRHRRRRHGHHAAQPRQPLLAAAGTSRTCSRQASGRSTRSCPRW